MIPYMNKNGIIIVDDYKSGEPNGFHIPCVTRACDDIAVEYKDTLVKSEWNKLGKGFCIFTVV